MARGRLATSFKKSVLDSGVTVVTENHPAAISASCGIWVKKGTRDEFPNERGLAHFVEHLVFKRTKKRNAYQISAALDAVGGELNAFTSRENTCFVSHSLREHLELSLDVLSDLVANPVFDARDIEKEKQVVVQEIRMAEDQLEESVFDRFFAKYFSRSSLGFPILGTVESIEAMRPETIRQFHKRQYRAENIIVSVAGRIEHRAVVNAINRYLKLKPAMHRRPSPLVIQSADTTAKLSSNDIHEREGAFREVYKRRSEQAHVLVGFKSCDVTDPLRFSGYVVNSLLGGGMTSRLYQTVREERGLVYSVYSQLNTFMDCGLCTIYAGTDPKKVPEVLELIFKECRRLRRQGLNKRELAFFKTQVMGGILLGSDDIENRMNSIGFNEMVYGRYRSVEQVMKDVDKVSLESVQEFIETRLGLDQLNVLVVGPMPEAPLKRWMRQL